MVRQDRCMGASLTSTRVLESPRVSLTDFCVAEEGCQAHFAGASRHEIAFVSSEKVSGWHLWLTETLLPLSLCPALRIVYVCITLSGPCNALTKGCVYPGTDLSVCTVQGTIRRFSGDGSESTFANKRKSVLGYRSGSGGVSIAIMTLGKWYICLSEARAAFVHDV